MGGELSTYPDSIKGITGHNDYTMDRNAIVQQALTVPGMTTETELLFLYDLAIQTQVGEQFVELGTYLGRTLTVLAHGGRVRQKTLISLDNYSYDSRCSLDGVHQNLVTNGFTQELTDGKIFLLEGDSRQCPKLIREIGLLFIDSDHFRRHFDAEMAVWSPMVAKGGIIACHDYTSPTWLEMTGAIDGWMRNPGYKYLGLARRLIAFRKLD